VLGLRGRSLPRTQELCGPARCTTALCCVFGARDLLFCVQSPEKLLFRCAWARCVNGVRLLKCAADARWRTTAATSSQRLLCSPVPPMALRVSHLYAVILTYRTAVRPCQRCAAALARLAVPAQPPAFSSCCHSQVWAHMPAQTVKPWEGPTRQIMSALQAVYKVQHPHTSALPQTPTPAVRVGPLCTITAAGCRCAAWSEARISS